MKTSPTKYLLPLALGSLLIVGAGCAGSSKTATNVETGMETKRPAAEQPIKPARQLEVDMKASSTLGMSGKALLVEESDKTKVMLNLSADKTGTHPAHIHNGSCAVPGQVKYSLSDVVGGRSVTLVDVKFDDLAAAMSSGLAINVHKSSAEIGIYLSCGDLLASKVMEKQAGAEAMMEASGEAKMETGGTNVNSGLNLNVNAGGTVSTSLIKTVKVTAKQFTFEPAEIRVKQGTTVTLEIASTDVDHGIALPAFNVNSILKAGTTTSVTFLADKKGSYPFFCSVFCGSGHGSMRGTLIVE